MIKSSAIVARPYARAVFSLAQAEHKIPEWEDALVACVDIVTHADMLPLLNAPQFTPKALADLFCKIGQKKFSDEAKRFINLLCEFDRIAHLPAILSEFIELKNAAMRRLDVRVESATLLDEQMKEKLAAKLKKRFDRDIHLTVEVNEKLIAGACIYAGDQVIDGSVLGRIHRLTEKLTSEAR
jgi:F-type H+-transporting ATPase subunit delta